MAKKTRNKTDDLIKDLVAQNKDSLKELFKSNLEEFLEGKMSEHLGAGLSERCDGRKGYRSGYYTRSLVTRVGALELRVPRERGGNFSTELFERF